MNEELLNIKLQIPPDYPGRVFRPRLKAQLEAGLSARFILISAPAGFGKTSLLRECLGDYPGPLAWISLDRGDNDPARFLRYFIAGTGSISPEISQKMGALVGFSQSGSPDIKPVMTFIINELAKNGKQTLIILDDYHFIESKDIHEAVAFLIDNAPSQVHIVISTRSDPPFPTARWRVRGQMAEIRGDDLRFSIEETGNLLEKRLGRVLPTDDIITLEEKTEGWAAGLQMAVLSMQGSKKLFRLHKTLFRQSQVYHGLSDRRGPPTAARRYASLFAPDIRARKAEWRIM